jgi:hypothetical protein
MTEIPSLADKIDIVYMKVQDTNTGKIYQKPFMKIIYADDKEVLIQLRNDINITDFSRLLVSALDYNIVSTSFEFSKGKQVADEAKEEVENKEIEE